MVSEKRLNPPVLVSCNDGFIRYLHCPPLAIVVVSMTTPSADPGKSLHVQFRCVYAWRSRELS
ncbi:unnamed protein product [Protopolystoma xenopodis]|uniref:Uncharacterized protein n=1 Tax=Protopolystoma xenopodis TaxID=117903 RepID=A0A3S5FEH5_9PLAT|nr:unnamed protein product [Protopolystoma xenopodis]